MGRFAGVDSTQARRSDMNVENVQCGGATQGQDIQERLEVISKDHADERGHF